jgi:16S rRNA processing protein RimM
VLLGEVLRPHGLEGLLRVRSHASSERSFLDAGDVFLKTAAGEIHECTVASVRPYKGVFLVRLKEITTVGEAEKCRGAGICVRRDALARESDEEYFWYELLNLNVYLDTGKCLGRIAQIIPTGSNDIYVVQDGEKEVLIPATHEVVKEIDLKGGRMIVSPMDGLLDLDEI